MSKSAAALLEEIIGKMGMEATVDSSINDENNIVLDVSSESSAILIGRKGRNLDALQFLITRMMLQGDDAATLDRIDAALQGLALGALFDAAEDDGVFEGSVFAVGGKAFTDLGCQFARGGEDQCADRALELWRAFVAVWLGLGDIAMQAMQDG